jgi:hypothetical protein
MRRTEWTSVSAGLRGTTDTISDFGSQVYYPCDYHKHFRTNEHGEKILRRGGKLLDNVGILTTVSSPN